MWSLIVKSSNISAMPKKIFPIFRQRQMKELSTRANSLNLESTTLRDPGNLSCFLSWNQKFNFVYIISSQLFVYLFFSETSFHFPIKWRFYKFSIRRLAVPTSWFCSQTFTFVVAKSTLCCHWPTSKSVDGIQCPIFTWKQH